LLVNFLTRLNPGQIRPPQPDFPDAVLDMLDVGLVHPFEADRLHQPYDALETRTGILDQASSSAFTSAFKRQTTTSHGNIPFLQ
jgi:hypothetical protein